MAHADDATKAWVSAIPITNGDDNVVAWDLKYKYTLIDFDCALENESGSILLENESGSLYMDEFVHVFDQRFKVDPTKAKSSYTQAELLALNNGLKVGFKDHSDVMFNKKYANHILTIVKNVTDEDFDVTGLSAS
tara:strand:+ start:220 stop:624 length:405 start_codon:yes stop_codon:yes gene_type:complete